MNKMLSALLYITLTSASARALPPNHTIKVSPTSSSPLFYVFLMGNKSAELECSKSGLCLLTIDRNNISNVLNFSRAGDQDTPHVSNVALDDSLSQIINEDSKSTTNIVLIPDDGKASIMRLVTGKLTSKKILIEIRPEYDHESMPSGPTKRLNIWYMLYQDNSLYILYADQ